MSGHVDGSLPPATFQKRGLIYPGRTPDKTEGAKNALLPCERTVQFSLCNVKLYITKVMYSK